jgi:hypothetical protein
MNKILSLYVSPTKVFTNLKEKPEWFMPLIIVLIVIALSTALTVSMTRETIIAHQEEAMRNQGMSEERIEEAMKMTSGPFLVISSVIGAILFTLIIILLFSFVLNIFIPLFHGKSAFKNVFSVICYSSLIKVLSAILRLIMVAITKSPYVTASLALFAPNIAKASFVYRVLIGFDFFIFWEMVLVAMGINITNELEKKNAYILVFLIWIASIFIGAALGVFGPRR